MNRIVADLGKDKRFDDLLKNIENKTGPIEISGLTDVGESLILSGIHEYSKRPIFIVTYNEIQARKIADNLKYFIENVYLLPKKEIVTYDYVAESKDLPYERIEILNKIYEKKNIVIVTTIETIKQKIISKKELYKNVLDFEIGKRCDLEKLKQKLIDLGYTRYN